MVLALFIESIYIKVIIYEKLLFAFYFFVFISSFVCCNTLYPYIKRKKIKTLRRKGAAVLKCQYKFNNIFC